MAKIDKFLTTMVSRGAPLLRLDPGDTPVLELPGGHRTPLSGQELLGTVLDGLAKEILPRDQETAYLRGDKVQFDYTADGERFQVLVARSSLGTRIVVGRLTGSGGKGASGGMSSGAASRFSAAVPSGPPSPAMSPSRVSDRVIPPGRRKWFSRT